MDNWISFREVCIQGHTKGSQEKQGHLKLKPSRPKEGNIENKKSSERESSEKLNFAVDGMKAILSIVYYEAAMKS